MGGVRPGPAPGSGQLRRGLLAEWRRPSPRALNLALHGASGIFFAVIAVDRSSYVDADHEGHGVMITTESME